MKIDIGNGALQVENSPKYTPRAIDAVAHYCDREVEVRARYWEARKASASEPRGRKPYVSVTLCAQELPFEVPVDGRPGRASKTSTFIDVDAARALRDALIAALENVEE